MKDLSNYLRIFITLKIMTIIAFYGCGQNNGTVQKQSKITFQNVVFGRDVCGIGDLNKDGINDVAIGAPEDFNNEVYILFLDSTGTIKDHTIIASNQSGFDVNIGAEDDFGNSIANVGDLNNDGTTDIAVGTPFGNYGGFDKGGVWVLFLNPDGTVKDYQQISDISGNFNTSLKQEDRFGEAVGSKSNNSLPNKQLLVGTPERNNGNGSFFILSLSDSGTVTNEKELSNNSINFSITSYDLGSSVEGIGDINKDGYPDVMVGDLFMKVNNEFKGGIWILFLNENENIKGYQKITEDHGNFNDTLLQNSWLGNSTTLLNDINGDNIQDIAVGAYGDGYPNDTMLNTLTGKTWILFLDSNGTVKNSQVIGNGFGNFQDTLKTGDRFGRGVANIGDLNGDSVPELGVGAPGHGGDQKGSVFILFLNGVPQSSGINTSDPVRQLNTYPNPLSQSQQLTLQLPNTIQQSSPVRISVFDMNGRQVHQKAFQYNGQEKLSLQLPELAKGTYQLYMKAGTFQGFSKVVVGG